METLPPEMLVKILIYVGGVDFVNFRKTCKRYKSIADYLEINDKPALWFRYVFRDFPLAGIETTAPWLYLEDKSDSFLWKILYLRLYRICRLKHNMKIRYDHTLSYQHGYGNRGAPSPHLVYNHLITDETSGMSCFFMIDNSPTLPSLVDMKKISESRPGRAPGSELKLKSFFAAPFLFIKSGVNSLPALVVDLDECALHFNKMTYFSNINLPAICKRRVSALATWTNFVLAMPSDLPPGDLRYFYVINVSEKSGTESTYRKIYLSQPYSCQSDVVQACFNDRYIVWCVAYSHFRVAQNRKTASKFHPATVKTFQFDFLPKKKCLTLCGDLLILNGKSALYTAELELEESSGERYIEVYRIQRLNFPIERPVVKAFDVKGQVFAALLGGEKVCISIMERFDRQSVEDGMSIHRIGVASEHLSLDVEDGIKIAIGGESLSRLFINLIYVDRDATT